LPIGSWSEDYKEFLFDLYNSEDGKKTGLKEFKNACNDVQVKITLYFEEDAYAKYKENQDEFMKTFKLANNLKTSNMCAFDESMNIVKFSNVGKILDVFYNHRLQVYSTRRKQCIASQEKVIEELDGKVRFIQGVIDGKIALLNQSDEALIASLQKHKIPPCSAPYKKEDLDSYHYVLHLRVDTMKKSGLEQAQKELAKAHSLLEYYHKNNEVSLWLQELDEFTESYNLFMKNTLEFLETSQEGVIVEDKKKKKKAVAK
jgi:DNA topoisomerase-2